MSAPAAAQAAARVVGLVKRFGATCALDGISAQLPAGMILGLVGPDGAGKTTLIRLFAGLMEPSAGTVEVLGRPPRAQGGTTQAETGYMPQRFGLYEDLSVLDNLNLYANLRALESEARRQRFAELLRFTGLSGFTARLAGQLSGGMKQKLGLACALLGRPRLLLLDEPGVGVDPLSRRELWRMVSELVASGVTVLWSTAYLEEAERCAHIWLLDAGRLLYDGPPSELRAGVRGRVFRRRVPAGRARHTAERELERAAVLDAVIQGASVRLVVRPGGAGEFQGADYEPVPPRLEDAYVELLGGARKGESLLARGWPAAGTTAQPGAAADGTPPGAAGDGVLVRAQALTRRFGDFVAADSIGFEVHAGEIYGLLGPNGAGKSTTFRMLCGLLRPTAGDATVAGVNLLHAASRARAHLGYMAQKFSLYGDSVGRPEPRLLRRHLWPDAKREARARSGDDRDVRAHPASAGECRATAARLQAAPGARLRHAARPKGTVPRRADQWCRPTHAARVLAPHQRPHRARCGGGGHDALHGGGGVLRSHRTHLARPQDRRGHAR